MNKSSDQIASSRQASFFSKLKRRILGEPTRPDLKLIRSSRLFDAKWYYKTYPDIAESGVDAAEHYLHHGGLEGRDPSPYFHSSWYLRTYKDVREAGLNPLLHFLESGYRESRQPMSKTALAKIDSAIFSGLNLDVANGSDDDDEAHIEMVRNSHLFDGRWYLKTYEDVAQAQLDPAAHYFRQGWREHRQPSPKFESEWYINTYTEVQKSGLNPLVYHLLYGEAAGLEPIRPIRPANLSKDRLALLKENADALTPDEQIALDTARVADSDLFDAKWYLATYPAVAREGFDPAFHYTRFGGFEGKNPSINFDSDFYLSRMPELKTKQINPLLHYLTQGQAEGLKPLAVLQFEPAGEVTTNKREDMSRPPQEPWPLASKQGQIFVGKRQIGIRPVETATRSAVLSAFDSYLDPLLAFCQLSGVKSKVLTIKYPSDEKLHSATPRHTPDFSRINSLAAAAYTGRVTVADAWMVNATRIRLRLDLATKDSLLADSKEALHFLRIYQYEIDTLSLTEVGASGYFRSDTAFTDATLPNPFMPLLLVITDSNGLLLDIQILPFPSLCRGGVHHGEVSFPNLPFDRMNQLRAYSDGLIHEWAESSLGTFSIGTIAVEAGGTGQERIFSPALLTWMNKICEISVSLKDPVEVDDIILVEYLRDALESQTVPIHIQDAQNQRAENANLQLVLPSDSVPSLAALMSRRLNMPSDLQAALCTYIACNSTSQSPLCAVTLPRFDSTLIQLQPNRTDLAGFSPYVVRTGQAPASATSLPTTFALSLRFNTQPGNSLAQVMPRGNGDRPVIGDTLSAAERDAFRVHVIVSHQAGDDVLTFAASLKNQTLSDCISDITFVEMHGKPTEIDRSLAHFFPSRYEAKIASGLNYARNLNRVVSDTKTPFILFCDATVLMPDKRTLECLYRLLEPKDVATAGCVLMHDRLARNEEKISFITGGYFASHISLSTRPSLSVHEPDCLSALPNTTYPVVGNNFRLALVKRAAWQAVGGLDEVHFPGSHYDVDFGLRTLASGFRHMTTSAIRGVAEKTTQAYSFTDNFSSGFLTIGDWQNILQGCTMVQDLRK